MKNPGRQLDNPRRKCFNKGLVETRDAVRKVGSVTLKPAVLAPAGHLLHRYNNGGRATGACSSFALRRGVANMRVATYEAVVENGQIRLPLGLPRPEHAKVYVLVPGTAATPVPGTAATPVLGTAATPVPGTAATPVPGIAATPVPYIASPRLVHPEQAEGFVLSVEEDRDAGL